MSVRMKKPSKEGDESGKEQIGHINDYKSETLGTVSSGTDNYRSDSMTDSSSRGGPLGSSNEMPEGGDSTRFPEKAKKR